MVVFCGFIVVVVVGNEVMDVCKLIFGNCCNVVVVGVIGEIGV